MDAVERKTDVWRLEWSCTQDSRRQDSRSLHRERRLRGRETDQELKWDVYHAGGREDPFLMDGGQYPSISGVIELERVSVFDGRWAGRRAQNPAFLMSFTVIMCISSMQVVVLKTLRF